MAQEAKRPIVLPAEGSFGWWVRHHRNRRGLSQNQLARRSGIDPAYVNRFESGDQKRASLGVVLALAETLELSFIDTEKFRHVAGLATQDNWIIRAQRAERIIDRLRIELEDYEHERTLHR